MLGGAVPGDILVWFLTLPKLGVLHLLLVVIRGKMHVYFCLLIYHSFFFHIGSGVLIILNNQKYFTECNDRNSRILLTLNKLINRCSPSDISVVRGKQSL